MYSAARGRPAADEVLLIRQRGLPDEPPSDIWEFPRVGDFDVPADLEPWTDSVSIARVDSPFDPPLDAADYQWVSADFARTCPPTVFDPAVPPALRRFDGDPLDLILARLSADSRNSQGDDSMDTSTASRSDFTAAQIKCDRVAHAFGDSAPPPLAGERLHDYRARLASLYQRFSKSFKNANLSRVGDPVALSAVEDAIYNDALAEAKHPTSASLKPGELRAVVTLDAANRPITRYVGGDGACWNQFNPPVRHVQRFNTSGRTA